jgi:hypothetical protein
MSALIIDSIARAAAGANTDITSLTPTGSVTANSGNPLGKAILGGLPADPVNYGGLWFGVTPDATNYSFLGTTGQTFLNAGISLSFRIANNDAFVVNNATATVSVALVVNGDLRADKTITPGGTNGAQTINKNAGSVNFAASASSLVVTNSRVTTSSVIVCTVGTNDATLKSVNAVAAAGSFTITGNAAATAATRVNFIVIN